MKIIMMLSSLIVGLSAHAATPADYLRAVENDREVTALEAAEMEVHNLACAEPQSISVTTVGGGALAYKLDLACNDINGGANATTLTFTGKIYSVAGQIQVVNQTLSIQQSE